ncbi:MAG: M16 family metallopeptidase [Bdellovibrionota bacterium]
MINNLKKSFNKIFSFVYYLVFSFIFSSIYILSSAMATPSVSFADVKKVNVKKINVNKIDVTKTNTKKINAKKIDAKNSVSNKNIAIASFERLFDKVVVKTLKNGLTIIMYKRGHAPVFSGIVSVRVGGSDEKVGKTGISHFFEHLAFKGTKTIGTKNYRKEKKLLSKLEKLSKETKGGNVFTKAQKVKWDNIHKELIKLWDSEAFSKEYEKKGASNFNASTDKDITRYYVSFPKSEFEFWAQSEVDRILNPVPRQFYQERDVILEERKMRFENSPQGKMYENFLRVMFLTHPYRNPVIGYESDIKNLTASDIEEFHKKYYVPSNMVVAVVGDIDVEKDFQILEKYFSKIPYSQDVERNVLKEGKQEGERRVNFNYNANRSMIVAYHKPNYPHKDDLSISVLAQILAGSKISPLYKKLVIENKCASYVVADEGPGSAYQNFISFYIIPNGNCSNDKIIEIYNKVIADSKANGFTSEELKIAKKNILTSTISILNSNEALAKMLAEARLLYGDHKMILKSMNDLEKIGLKDLKRVLNKYFVLDNTTIATMGK